MFAGLVTCGVQCVRLSYLNDDVVLKENIMCVYRSSDGCGVQCVRLSHVSDDVILKENIMCVYRSSDGCLVVGRQ